MPHPSTNMGPIVDAEVNLPAAWLRVLGPNQYHRVRWEDYNAAETVGVFPPAWTQNSDVDDGWITEVLTIGTRVYTDYPFSTAPRDVPPDNSPTPPGETQCQTAGGVWVAKLGVCFTSQQALEDYVALIGSSYTGNTLVGGYYGADLAQEANFMNPTLEREIYLCENSGGFYAHDGNCYVDERTMMYTSRVNRDGTETPLDGAYFPDIVGGRNDVNSGTTRNDRMTFPVVLDRDPDFTPPPSDPNRLGGDCYMFRFNAGTPTGNEGTPPPNPRPRSPATVIPGIPNLPNAGSNVAITVQFPYANLPAAIMTALGSNARSFLSATQQCFSIFQSVTFPGFGLPEFPNIHFTETINRLAADAMNEAKQIAAAIPLAVRQAAIRAAREAVEPILTLVGGVFNLLENLVPNITIAGILIDPFDVLFNIDNPVQWLLDQLYALIDAGTMTATQAIQAMYTAIGSTVDYATATYRSVRKDIVDAADQVWNFICLKVEMGFVGLMNYLGRLAQIFTIPPTPPPNPIWLAIVAVNNLFGSIYDGLLANIMSGNFPGFTAQDLFDLMIAAVNTRVAAVMQQVQALRAQIAALETQLAAARDELLRLQRRLADGELVQDLIDAQNALIADLTTRIAGFQTQIDNLLLTIRDKWTILLAALDDISLVGTINNLLGFIGLSVNDLLTLVNNGYNRAMTAVSSFYDEVKSWCKTIMDQVSTLPMTIVTEWVNRIIRLLGGLIQFPPVTITIPAIAPVCFPVPSIPEVPAVPRLPGT